MRETGHEDDETLLVELALEASSITKQDQMRYGVLNSDGTISVTVSITSLGFDVLSVYPEEVEGLVEKGRWGRKNEKQNANAVDKGMSWMCEESGKKSRMDQRGGLGSEARLEKQSTVIGTRPTGSTSESLVEDEEKHLENVSLLEEESDSLRDVESDSWREMESDSLLEKTRTKDSNSITADDREPILGGPLAEREKESEGINLGSQINPE